MRVFLTTLILILLLQNSVEAGIFDSLFGHREKKSDVIVEEEPAEPFPEESRPQEPGSAVDKEKVIIEEEVISADEYMDSSDENQDTVFPEEAVPEEPAYNEESALSEEEMMGEISSSQIDEESDPFIKVRNILLSYTQKPEKIYLGQHFSVGIKAIIPQTNVKAIQTEFLKGNAYRILNPDTPWVKTGENSYENTFWFKVTAADAKLPIIKVTNQTESGAVKSELLKPFSTRIVSLREDPLFSHVIADKLQVMHHQERIYDEMHNIVVMDINATNSNLEDFNITYTIRQGIDQITQNGQNQKIYYFAIVPNTKKRFKFKYFNPKRNRFEVISFDIKPIDTKISTHTELNPQKNKYVIYKVIFLITMALLFIGLFIYKHKIYYLLAALFFIVMLAYVQIPIRKTTLPQGTALRILPMQSSTVFFRTERAMEVDILLRKRNYTKVLLPNKKIGWVKNDAIR